MGIGQGFSSADQEIGDETDEGYGCDQHPENLLPQGREFPLAGMDDCQKAQDEKGRHQQKNDLDGMQVHDQPFNLCATFRMVST